MFATCVRMNRSIMGIGRKWIDLNFPRYCGHLEKPV
jgi:hypothetical protein